MAATGAPLKVLVTAASRHGATAEIAAAISSGPVGKPQGRLARAMSGDPVEVAEMLSAASTATSATGLPSGSGPRRSQLTSNSAALTYQMGGCLSAQGLAASS